MPESQPQRFEPHAARAMASMFDDVSGRYDLLNRVMTLGQDGAWREAMWRRVPESARTVLDLCTGSGVSLPGLRRPGRLVLGVDVSFAMLESARDTWGGPGWAPRVACANAFHLPLRDGSLDAITVAFGVRNLRPRPAALAELARVLRPGGVLVVLEAAAPSPGPLRPFHAFWVRRVIPLAGRLSPDPTAYRYLSESIFEFGAGPEFEHDLAGAGFSIAERRVFLLGATRLWVARRDAAVGQNRAAAHESVRSARPEPENDPTGCGPRPMAADRTRVWVGLQAVVSATLAVTLTYALFAWNNVNIDLHLSPPQRAMGWTLLVTGFVVFWGRTLWLVLRFAAAGRGD
jgi:demethylmenaquinone methyltransferase/2-methoxy-6-polyprenyl-1,4-benzoquinol methylase